MHKVKDRTILLITKTIGSDMIELSIVGNNKVKMNKFDLSKLSKNILLLD